MTYPKKIFTMIKENQQQLTKEFWTGFSWDFANQKCDTL